ncbi:SIS domain-containing protein [uncultured Desulfovibrio sp.]|uniref:SIS domain-containing protein n=1 Tax=uncultured Desulfovibrio sp. TaxID=167968 RepID=UPI0026359E03|nr:SIS domain-containing protein [uncultured Desulfovibrio sp.]
MQYISNLLQRVPCLSALQEALHSAVDLLQDCTQHGNKILVCGNGGSAADAEHIVGELMKGFLLQRPLTPACRRQLICNSPYPVDNALLDKLQQPVPALSLVSGVALPTAFANDVDAEYSFAQQVLGLGKPGDVLWAISTSGNSRNLIHALRLGRAMGLRTLGFTGRDGGTMAQYCDVEIRVPAQTTPAVQELHLPIYHALCAQLEQNIFGTNCLSSEKTFQSIHENILQSIRLIIFDFDGVFTDNKVMVAQDGTESVTCSRADSLGLAMLKKAGGPKCCILSTELNPVVQARAHKLGIVCFQGCGDKKKFLIDLMKKENISRTEILYMGNDLNDYAAMALSGLSAAPADAHPDIRKLAQIKLAAAGGNGAVRELCELFLANKRG